MTKSDLVDMLAGKSAMSKKSAKEFVDMFVGSLAHALSGGSKVTLTGFGTFEVRTRKARMGVRPGTTMRIKIPATKYPAFKAGKALKEAVSGR
ncbi:MAG: HU family DNA-binding protein [Deinococcus sp.]|nr:HU family DNA-binding protein [Deinococcus sp.]